MKEITTLMPNDTLMQDIERARAIEQSELLALDRLSESIGDYFINSEVSVRSIASHCSRFMAQPDITFSHPIQLEQACQQFIDYLKTKKPYSQNGIEVTREPIRRYVSDKLLEIAFKRGLLASVKVKREVDKLLIFIDITGNIYHINGRAQKRFIERLSLGDVDIAHLPKQAVSDAFAELSPELMERLRVAAKLALEVKNEAP
ncbi:hypothetical protein [Methylobacter sp. YRD-M1]|uniref:hypothetical protein n=1 Tax=Methylobacter sp. YRD-M1 TaxID=2911520 RepID=UPI00227C51B3|nr:hypothetical protein [Methylobacter sp. YRD-M1]WAK03158.1 phage integrase SAM-like domain-containing protein [Methylobacter sp. YRD-M1]